MCFGDKYKDCIVKLPNNLPTKIKFCFYKLLSRFAAKMDKAKIRIEKEATEKEITLVQMLADEMRPKDIASKWKVSHRTVESYILSIKKTFGCFSEINL
jgi:DNA-binding NarL/FixJ family response regulator